MGNIAETRTSRATSAAAGFALGGHASEASQSPGQAFETGAGLGWPRQFSQRSGTGDADVNVRAPPG